MNNKPIKKFRSGQVSLTVFQGEYKGKSSYSFSPQKSYKDKNDQWQNVNFYNKTDLSDLLNCIIKLLGNSVKEQMVNGGKEPVPADVKESFPDAEVDDNSEPIPF